MAGKIRRIWDAIAACFEANDQPLTMGQIKAWVGVHYLDNGLHPATLDAQVRRSCINVPFAQKYKAPKILFYDQRTRTYSNAVNVDPSSRDHDAPLSQSDEFVEDEVNETSPDDQDKFEWPEVLEAQLRDYLAKNLSKLEAGLTLWQDSPPSVEYPIDGKRIDILAKDLQGIPVVVELKRRKGYDKVLGQALLYQALIATRLKLPRVRVILVASLISPELLMACSLQLDFKLFEYEITMQLNPVSSLTSEEED